MDREKNISQAEQNETDITAQNIVAITKKLINDFQVHTNENGKRALFDDIQPIEKGVNTAHSQIHELFKENEKIIDKKITAPPLTGLDKAVRATITYNAEECLQNINDMIVQNEDIIAILTAISYIIPQPLGQLGPEGSREMSHLMQKVQRMIFDSGNLQNKEEAQQRYNRIISQYYAFSGQMKFAQEILRNEKISETEHAGTHGILELKKGNYNTAMEHFGLSLVLLQKRFYESTEFHQKFYYINRMATITNLMAIVSWKLGKADEVTAYETASKNILDHIGNKVGVALIESNLNFILLYKPDFSIEESMKIHTAFIPIIKLFHETNSWRNYMRASLNSSINLIHQGMLHTSTFNIEQADRCYEEGVKALESIERIAEETEINALLIEIRNVLTKGYQLQGKIREAEKVNQKILNQLERERKKNGGYSEKSEVNLQNIIAGIHQVCLQHRVSIHDRSVSQNKNVLTALIDKIGTIIQEVFENDEYTRGHSLRVGPIVTKIFGSVIREDPFFQRFSGLIEVIEGPILGLAGVNHDIGKIGIPRERILLKPGPLTKEQREEMNRHTVYGGNFIRQLAFDLPFGGGQIFELLYRVITEHHENWDGSGYPNGKSGQDIHVLSRLVAVADTIDALCSNRPYRKPVRLAGVLHYINEKSGIQFDPKVVELMNLHFSRDGNIEELEKIFLYDGEKLDYVPGFEANKDPCDGNDKNH